MRTHWERWTGEILPVVLKYEHAREPEDETARITRRIEAAIWGDHRYAAQVYFRPDGSCVVYSRDETHPDHKHDPWKHRPTGHVTTGWWSTDEQPEPPRSREFPPGTVEPLPKGVHLMDVGLSLLAQLEARLDSLQP